MEHLHQARSSRSRRGRGGHASQASGTGDQPADADHPPSAVPTPRRGADDGHGAGDQGLDRLLDQLRGSAREVVASESRLRGLLEANQVVASELSLNAVTERVGQAARLLLGAGYSALGVGTPRGDGLRRVVHSAVDDAMASRVSGVLERNGVLTLLADVDAPVRMSGLGAAGGSGSDTADDRSVTRFLAVPIRVRGATYGHLYLADGDGEAFTPEDLELATVFATTASTAIENAMRFEDAARRQRWLDASAEAALHLLTLESDDERLQALADRICVLAEADVATVVVPSGDGDLRVRAVAGDRADEVLQATVRAAGPAAVAALDLEQPVLAGPAIAVPLVGSRAPRVSLVASRGPDRPGFEEADIEMAAMFARHAAASLDLSLARAEEQRDLLLGDRDRLAEALNGSIIRRLFAAGLTIQSIAASLESAPAAARLVEVADDLDETIRQIRARIFDDRRAD